MAFTDPIHKVWFLIEEHPSVIHTSHVPLVCVPCEPRGSACRKIFSDEIRNELKSGDQAIFEMKSLD